jgi:hypothetical protein
MVIDEVGAEGSKGSGAIAAGGPDDIGRVSLGATVKVPPVPWSPRGTGSICLNECRAVEAFADTALQERG